MQKNSAEEHPKFEKVSQHVPAMTFLGEVEGDGLSYIRMELAAALQDFNFVRNAYLSKLKYQGEEEVRIALVVDSSSPTAEVGPAVAQRCAEILPMDILFVDSIPAALFEEIKADTTPLYLSDMALFECPIVIGRGTNTEMPENWAGAVVTYYSCGTNYEDALMNVAKAIIGQGYEFREVYEGKVSQIDPEAWWDSLVMGKWPEYSEHFPDQQEIHLMVKTGGLFKGPTVGWDAE